VTGGGDDHSMGSSDEICTQIAPETTHGFPLRGGTWSHLRMADEREVPLALEPQDLVRTGSKHPRVAHVAV
jgi:hypothetical protein